MGEQPKILKTHHLQVNVHALPDKDIGNNLLCYDFNNRKKIFKHLIRGDRAYIRNSTGQKLLTRGINQENLVNQDFL